MIDEFARQLGALVTPVPRRLGLAVSGGVDSMALAFLVSKLNSQLRDSLDIHAFTVDHGVRQGSDEEASKVQKNLSQLGITSHVLKMKLEPELKTSPKFELIARNHRTRLLYDACASRQIRHLLFAHTFDDQLETFLMRLMRGSSIIGLAGMNTIGATPQLLAPCQPPLTYLRPLVGFTKTQLYDICIKNNVQWYEDHTNHDPSYAVRNGVRYLLQNPSLLPQFLQPEAVKKRLIQVQSLKQKINHRVDQVLYYLRENRLLSLDLDHSVVCLKLCREFLDLPLIAQSTLLLKPLQRIMPLSDPMYRQSSIQSALAKLGPSCETVTAANIQIHFDQKSHAYIFTRAPPYGDQKKAIRLDIPSPSILGQWSDYHLFDHRYWIRVKISDSAAAPQKISVTLDDPLKYMDLFNETLGPQDWPKSQLVAVQPLILADGVPIGYPTLGILKPMGFDVELRLKDSNGTAENSIFEDNLISLFERSKSRHKKHA
uniref:tRNA(Ile)-lysidine synthetase n=1 Tax=Blastobotrys adeninivorans TaxID=409370 RepID=A0A060T3R5_BLAAD